jgi:hypothetical protein
LTSLRLRARLAQVIGEREVLLEAWLKWAAHPEASPGERVVLLDQSADLALALGRPEQALGLLEVLASRPEAPPLARRRALLLERLGERRAALGAWQLVLSEEQDAIARLAVVDVMLGHARALSDHRLERTLLLQALALSGQATDRLRDLRLRGGRSCWLPKAGSPPIERLPSSVLPHLRGLADDVQRPRQPSRFSPSSIGLPHAMAILTCVS